MLLPHSHGALHGLAAHWAERRRALAHGQRAVRADALMPTWDAQHGRRSAPADHATYSAVVRLLQTVLLSQAGQELSRAGSTRCKRTCSSASAVRACGRTAGCGAASSGTAALAAPAATQESGIDSAHGAVRNPSSTSALASPMRRWLEASWCLWPCSLAVALVGAVSVLSCCCCRACCILQAGFCAWCVWLAWGCIWLWSRFCARSSCRLLLSLAGLHTGAKSSPEHRCPPHKAPD